MSSTGDSATSDTGDSQVVSDTGESSIFLDWSVVDEHGDLRDDDTTSTTSSVEIVEDDEPTDSQSTPIAGSPGGIAPRFILRLPSHEQVSDTDEDQTEDNSSGSSSARCDSREMASASRTTAKQANREGSSQAPVSQVELDELRQTLDKLKRNFQPSHGEDSSLSSVEMFGDGRPEGMNAKSGDDGQPQSFGTAQDVGGHGNTLSGDLSLDSSVSSSYSFLSRDTGTECSLLRDRSGSVGRENNSEQHTEDLLKQGISKPPLGTSLSGNQNESEADQQVSPAVTKQGNTSGDFLSLLTDYPMKYMFLAGLVAYTGFIILAGLYLHGQGPVPTPKGDVTDDVMLDRCLQNTQDLQTKLDIYKNAYQDSDSINRKKYEDLKSALEDELSYKLTEKERDILNLQNQLDAMLEVQQSKDAENQDLRETQEALQNENERLKKAVDESSHACARNEEEYKAQSHSDLQLCEKAKEEEKRQADKEIDTVRKQCQADVDKVKGQCQLDLDKVKGQCHLDLDKVKGQCQVDFDKFKSQCQIDKDMIRYQYQAEIESVVSHAEAEYLYTDGRCGIQPGQHWGDRNFQDNLEDEKNTKTTDEEIEPYTRSGDEKEKVDAQSETLEADQKHQPDSRGENEEPSGTFKSHEKKQDHEKAQFMGDNSEEYSSEGDQSVFNWADTVMELMNKTKEQIQDTWAKVKNMSETLWQEHQPTLLRLQDSFSRKLQHLGKKFHGKLARKMKKWFRKFKKHERHEDGGHKANTKRRQYTDDDDVSNSNRSVEERLVKLSYQVEALNAKKFRKWRELAKLLDIQREFVQVNTLLNAAQSEKVQQKENRLPDGYLGWFDCQFRWWKNLDVVTVTDDCYLSLCCWQVKVTGGEVKQCRKTKRKQGIVEDRCSLELISEGFASGKVKNSNNRYMNTKSKKVKKQNKHRKTQSTVNAQGHSDGTSGQAPATNEEENWFLEMGEERAYHREEPDDWFFRRKNKKAVEPEPASNDESDWYPGMDGERENNQQEQDDWSYRHKNKRAARHQKSKYFDDDNDWDEYDDYDDYDDECNFDFNTGDCIYG